MLHNSATAGQILPDLLTPPCRNVRACWAGWLVPCPLLSSYGRAGVITKPTNAQLGGASSARAALTCCCRLAQITKESFDFAQALLDLVVLAATVDTRRCRERFGHLYGRSWSQRECLSLCEADGRLLHYSPRHWHAHGVTHRLLCSAATVLYPWASAFAFRALRSCLVMGWSGEP